MTSRSAPEPTDSGELPLDRQSGVTDTAGEAMTTWSVSEPTDASEQPLDRQCEVTETDEERETRLALSRARYRARRAARSLPARETRLQQMRLAARHRRAAAESSADREGRLLASRLNQQQRIAIETSGDRAVQLQNLRSRQQQRIAAETSEDRAVRLKDLRFRQQPRLAAETPEQTEARQAHDREVHTPRSLPLSSALSLLHNPGVQAKMSKFHAQISSLQVATCITCMERFPDMTTRCTAAGTECIRCFRDKHLPKTYSIENNMHPGPVPLELVVSTVII